MIAALIVLLVIINFIVGLFALLRNIKRSANVTFFAFTTTISIWILANYFGSVVKAPHVAVLLVKTDFAFGLLLSNAFLIFCATLNSSLHSRWRYLLFTLIPTFIVVALVYLGKIVSIHLVANGVTTTFSNLEILYDPLIFGYLLLGIGILIYKRAHARNAQRAQISIVLYGIFIAALIVSFANIILPIFVKTVGVQNAVQRSAYITFFLFNILTTYAIIRHRLFDIRTVVARSVAYALLLVTIGTAYGLLAFRLGGYIFKSSAESNLQQFFNVALAIILAFTFQPLRRFFEKITDRVFYRDRYDPQTLVNDIGRILASEINLNNLSVDVLNTITHAMRLEKADLLVLDNGGLFFEAHTEQKDGPQFSRLNFAQLGRELLITDDLPPSPAKDLLQQLTIAASVPLATSKEFIGYLLLGQKRNGDILNDTDIRTLRIIESELAVAIQNARSFVQIQHFNETLQAKIAAATHELAAANAHLKEMDVVKDEFMSMASHQLGTPLTVIDGYISMVTGGIYGGLEPKQKQPLDAALKRVRLLKRLVADFLNVSRIQAGRFFIEREPTDLNQIVPEEVENLTEKAREKKVRVEIVKPPKPVPVINIDDQKTRQAIMNLIDNAIYYTPGGTVKVELNADAHNVTFKVVDNGIGVPEAQKAHLFTKFYRAGNAKRERPNGTGIGLFLVKRVIEDQGGQIIFDSTEGKGSTFGFSLPITAPAPATSPNNQASPSTHVVNHQVTNQQTESAGAPAGVASTADQADLSLRHTTPAASATHQPNRHN